MTKVHTDFLGPFVEANGQITRPGELSRIVGSSIVKCKTIPHSPKVVFSDDMGNQETWYACGSTLAYREARNSLPQKEFEHFAILACGPSLADRRFTQPARVRPFFPNGCVNYLSQEFQAHMALSKELEKRVHSRRAQSHNSPSISECLDDTPPLRQRMKS